MTHCTDTPSRRAAWLGLSVVAASAVGADTPAKYDAPVEPPHKLDAEVDLWLDAERTAERAGVSLAAMLASHQGSRPGPAGVARNLFVAKWKRQGEYGGLLRRLLQAKSDETVLKAQRRGEEDLERRAAQHLAEYQEHDGRPSPEHDDSPAAKRDRLTQSVELRRQAAERNPAEG
jgi:hypothetical protein